MRQNIVTTERHNRQARPRLSTACCLLYGSSTTLLGCLQAIIIPYLDYRISVRRAMHGVLLCHRTLIGTSSPNKQEIIVHVVYIECKTDVPHARTCLRTSGGKCTTPYIVGPGFESHQKHILYSPIAKKNADNNEKSSK